jgi:gas vesicle protein
MSDNGGGGSFFLGFLIGAMAGAAAAVLLTPQSGEELRRTIEQKSVDFKDEATRMAEDAKVQAQRLADEAKSQAQRVVDDALGQVEHVQEKGRIVISENVRKAQQAVEDAKEKLASELPAADTHA